MRKLFLLILYLSIMPSALVIASVQASYTKGEEGMGGQLYFVRDFIDENTDIVLIIYSELANQSSASSWEVSVGVAPQREDVGYVLDIRDSDFAQLEQYSSDAVLDPDEAEAIGTQRFGPWNVWADANLETLTWTFTIYSRDYKEVYLDAVMIWGYGARSPPEIVGSPDIDEDGQNGSLVQGVPPIVVFLSSGSILLAGKQAYGKLINSKIDESEVIVEGDEYE